MKVKLISGIVFMTLSSLSAAAGQSVAGTSVTNPPGTPQAERTKEPVLLRPLQHNPQPGVSRHKVSGAAARPATAKPAASPVTVKQTASPVVPRPSASAVTRMALNLQEGHLLSLDVGDWAKAKGMHLLWNSKRDYLIYSSINLTGKSRDEILNQLGQLFRSENYGLVVKLYEKNNVLVIDDQ